MGGLLNVNSNECIIEPSAVVHCIISACLTGLVFNPYLVMCGVCANILYGNDCVSGIFQTQSIKERVKELVHERDITFRSQGEENLIILDFTPYSISSTPSPRHA